MVDLWPDDISVGYGELRTPLAILKEQASLLGRKTQNLIEAKVTRERGFFDNQFAYGFHIVAPALDHYQYQLFKIEHGIQLYPVTISIDSDIGEEISPGSTDDFFHDASQLVVESEAEFLETLRRILGAKRTRQIIRALLAQSGASIDEEPPV